NIYPGRRLCLSRRHWQAHGRLPNRGQIGEIDYLEGPALVQIAAAYDHDLSKRIGGAKQEHGHALGAIVWLEIGPGAFQVIGIIELPITGWLIRREISRR